MIPRSLPYLNFVLASSSLTFQLMVLHPWHISLDESFEKLKAETKRDMNLQVQQYEASLKRIEGLLGGLSLKSGSL
ncbi:hypothetical protein T439DRAFT_320020 [Meredithblackwellia eburnea MCA 4105]